MSYESGLCDICGRDVVAFSRYHHDHPFADGRFYDFVCWTCLGAQGDNGVRTVGEMLEDGWSKQDAEISIRAIRKLMVGKNIAPIGGKHILGMIWGIELEC